MRARELPQAVLAKLVNLDQVATEFAASAQAAEARLAAARDIINGKNTGVTAEEYALARDNFDATFGAAKMAGSYAARTREVVAACRAWVESLPSDSRLLLVQPAAADLDLASLQANLEAMRAELSKLQAMPTPSDDVGERVREYVSGLMRQGAPVVRGFEAGGKLQVYWPDVGANPRNLNGYSTEGANPLLISALLMPEALAEVITRAVEATQLMPKAAWEARRAELVHGIDELSYVVAAMLERAGAPPDPKLGASHHLGIRVVDDAELTGDVAAA